jgi:hypothetical protein
MGRNPIRSYSINQSNNLIGKKVMTIAQQLGVTKFPLVIKNDAGKEIYREESSGCWVKREYNNNGKVIYFEDNTGRIVDSRLKPVPEYTMEELTAKLGHDFKIKK